MDDLYQTTLALLNIPLSDEFRVALRIYDIEQRAEASFRVRVFDQETHRLVSEHVMRTETTGLVESAPLTPGIAEIHEIRQKFTELSGVHGVVDIVIDPISPGLRYWAFVSLTNNSSQQVTTISPQ